MATSNLGSSLGPQFDSSLTGAGIASDDVSSRNLEMEVPQCLGAKRISGAPAGPRPVGPRSNSGGPETRVKNRAACQGSRRCASQDKTTASEVQYNFTRSQK